MFRLNHKKIYLLLLLLAICIPVGGFVDISTMCVLKPTHEAALAAIKLGEDTKEGVHPSPMFPATAVIIDVGHGGVDSGAVYGNLYEKDINLEVGKRLYALLQSRGIPAVLNRTHDYALSDDNRWHRTSSRHLRDLSQRMGLTREIEHVIFVSLHVNAGNSPRAHGPLVLHQQQGESYLLASSVQSEMNALFHTAKRPVAVNSIYILKYVKSPAVLIELGFISNKDDRARLTSSRELTKIAGSIADGISHYFWVN